MKIVETASFKKASGDAQRDLQEAYKAANLCKGWISSAIVHLNNPATADKLQRFVEMAGQIAWEMHDLERSLANWSPEGIS